MQEIYDQRRALAEETANEPEMLKVRRKHADYCEKLRDMECEQLVAEVRPRWNATALSTTEYERLTLGTIEWMRRGWDIEFFSRDGPVCPRIDDSRSAQQCTVQ